MRFSQKHLVTIVLHQALEILFELHATQVENGKFY